MPEPAPSLAGERRWTTVLFTDMANFSGASEAIGAERVYALMRLVIGLTNDCIGRHHGHTVDYAGDSILAVFGAPVALENASLHACMAARDIQHTLATHAPAIEADFGIRPAFRVGIAGGTIVLGQLGLNERFDVTVMGDAVNMAARLQALAQPGEILLSEAVYQQVEGFVAIEDLGEQTLKGFARKHRVYRLQDVREDTSRFEGLRRRGLVELVGRRQELDTLLGAARRATADLQLIAVSAPAGMGKSRLVHEFREQLADEAVVLVGQCNPSTEQVAYGPFVDIARLATGLSRTDPPELVAERLRPLLGEGDLSALAALFAGGPQALDSGDSLGDALRLRQQMQEMVAALSRNRSRVLVIEDAHWIDGLSTELVEQLIARESSSGILMLVTHRPNYSADWMRAPCCRRLALQPLDDVETANLISKRFDGMTVSPRLERIVADKAEGNPLFAEEIIRFLRSGDRLQLVDGRYDLTETDVAELISGNLQHLVLSRVDALPRELKPALQVAAAIGRRFSDRILRTAIGDDALVAAMYDRCGAETLIEADPAAEPGDWRFSHALIRDAIYASMLSSQRARVHARIAEAMRAHASDQLQDEAEVLAYHYVAAGNARMALPHLATAASRSQRLYAFKQANEQLETAFSLIARDPECVVDVLYGRLLVTWLRTLDQVGNFGALIRTADHLLPRLRDAGPSADLLVATTLYAIAKTHTRDYRGALAQAQETLAQADAHGDTHSAAWAKVALMRIHAETEWVGGETLERYAREIAPVAAAHGDDHLAMTALYLLCSSYRNSGEIVKAKAMAQRLQSFAQERGDRRAMAYSYWALGLINLVAGDPEATMRAAEQGIEHALPGSADAAVSWGLWANAQVLTGDPELARRKIEELLASATAHEDLNIVHSMLFVKALMLFKMGKVVQGWRMYESLLPMLRAAGNVVFVRQVTLVRVELLLTIAGLISRPRPSDGGTATPPRPKLGWRDLLMAMYLRLVARRKAAASLEAFCRAEPVPHGSHHARAQIALGILALARDRKEAARQHLKIARDLAMEQDLAHLVAQADACLARAA